MSAPEFNRGIDEAGVQIVHHMPDDGSGVYIKETRIPAGVRLAMHEHSFSHKSALVSGAVVLTVDGAQQPVAAPLVLSVIEGVLHEVLAVTDAVWLCIHSTNEIDPERVDAAITGATR